MKLVEIIKSRMGQFSQLLLMRLYAATASFLLTMLLGRLLGPAGFGVYVFALSWLGIAVLFSTFGFQHLAIRALPHMLVQKDRAQASGFILGAILIVLLLSLTISALAVFNPGLLVAETNLQAAIAAAGVLLLVRSLNLLRTGILQGLGHPIAGQVPERLVEPTLLLAVVALWLVFAGELTPQGAIYLGVGASLFGLLVGARSLKRAVTEIWMKPAFSKVYQWLTEASKSSVLFGAATILGATDVIMLGYLSTADETGLYGVAARFFLLLTLPFQAAAVRISQRAAQLHAENDMAGLEQFSRGLANRTLIASVALALISSLAAFYVELIFGGGFAGATVPILILVWARVFIAATGTPEAILANTHHIGTVTLIVCGAAVCNVALNAALVPPFGANGAAIATTLTLAIMVFALTKTLHSRLGIVSHATRKPWVGLISNTA